MQKADRRLSQCKLSGVSSPQMHHLFMKMCLYSMDKPYDLSQSLWKASDQKNVFYTIFLSDSNPATRPNLNVKTLQSSFWEQIKFAEAYLR